MHRIHAFAVVSLASAAGLCRAQTAVSPNDIAVGWSQGSATPTQAQLDNTIQLFSAP
jgi:hypothetical protein